MSKMTKMYSLHSLIQTSRCQLVATGACAMLWLAGAMACGTQGAPKTADPERADPYTTDTTYLRRVAYLKALSFTVPLDSLMRMYVRIADASQEETPALVREISCELARGATQYGVIPAALARERTYDSLRKARPDVFQRAVHNLDNIPVGSAITTDAMCNMVGMKNAPDSLNAKPVPEVIARKFRGQMPPQ